MGFTKERRSVRRISHRHMVTRNVEQAVSAYADLVSLGFIAELHFHQSHGCNNPASA